MENIFRKFYKSFYLHTGGFIPTQPTNQQIYPGDFFQIRNGEIIILGNIFQMSVVSPEDVDLGYGIKQNAAAWVFSDGIKKPYSGRGNINGHGDGEVEFSRLILAFAAKGSFVFKGNEPEVVKILNWNKIQQSLIIRLTQTCFSFREVYVVTESATTADWTLAISGTNKGELEIATDQENFGLIDIFGHPSARTIQSKDIEYYHRETKRKPCFFKAKKLVVQDERTEAFISELISRGDQKNEWVKNFYNNNFDDTPAYTPQTPDAFKASILDMLSRNELNPNTALSYFRWIDATFDDVEKLLLR